MPARTRRLRLTTLFFLAVFASVAAAPQTARVRDGGQDVQIRMPEKTKHVNPVYPEDAKEARTTGNVTVEYIIDTAGRVTNLRVAKSAHPSLDAAAVQAVTQWEYVPTRRDGELVEVMVTMVIVFDLARNR